MRNKWAPTQALISVRNPSDYLIEGIKPFALSEYEIRHGFPIRWPLKSFDGFLGTYLVAPTRNHLDDVWTEVPEYFEKSFPVDSFIHEWLTSGRRFMDTESSLPAKSTCFSQEDFTRCPAEVVCPGHWGRYPVEDHLGPCHRPPVQTRSR